MCLLLLFTIFNAFCICLGQVTHTDSSLQNSTVGHITDTDTLSEDTTVGHITADTLSEDTTVGHIRDTDTLSEDTTVGHITAADTLSEDTTLEQATNSSSQNSAFKTFVQLTTEDVVQCLQRNGTLDVHAVAGRISVTHQEPANKNGNCALQISVPQGKVLRLYMSLRKIPCNGYTVNMGYHDFSNITIRLACEFKMARIVTPGSRVILDVIRSELNASIELSINFTAASPPELQIIFITPTTGYVQSPDWDGRSTYPAYLDDWAQLDVPPNSSVMVSVISMDIEGLRNCSLDRLIIYVGRNITTNETTKLTHCNSRPQLRTTVFDTSVLQFHFKTDERMGYLGFRLYFTIHNQSEIPQQLANGKWNCSVPYWPKFQQHLMCNMVDECIDGEDEKHCSHTSIRCGPGLLSIGSRCYIFVSGGKRLTWNEAAVECRSRNAYLASLNTPEEWHEVINVTGKLLKEPVYMGLQNAGPSLPDAYRDWFQWIDGSVALYLKLRSSYASANSDCSLLQQNIHNLDEVYLKKEKCHEKITSSYICEKDVNQNREGEEHLQEIIIPHQEWRGTNDKYVVCPQGHATQKFLACDGKTACFAGDDAVSPSGCDVQMCPPPPSLQCSNGGDHVPFTLVCDHRSDCSDNSDENFCVFPHCHKLQCANKQCLELEKECDKITHCVDGSDEKLCIWYPLHLFESPKPPAIINFNRLGFYEIKSLTIPMNQISSLNTSVCPETHFLCPGNLTYCMPVFVRCNGVYDCPGRQDEDGCDRYQCPGYYRCRASLTCIHVSNLCDGVFHCPQHDDELLCEATCPQNCTCQGLAFFCHGQFPAEQYQELRFLHASESGLSPDILKQNSMLIYLNLAKCNLKYFNHLEFPNLRILDLSDNELSSLGLKQLRDMNNLQKLSLAGNPLKFLFATEHDSSLQFSQLEVLDLSNIILPELNVTDLTIFPKLMILNLTGCGIERVVGEGFQLLTSLRDLDMRNCPLTEFPSNIFYGLKHLKKVWTDNYKLCCPATLPEGFPLANCHSPSDEISSCDALLRSDFYRVVLSVFATMALIGNLGSFVYRVFINRASSSLGFGVFVTHLCVSDFLMGVYLAVIGIADRVYQGNYLWKDEEWKQSACCKMAGFLSLLSSEVSAFIICLITLDRFIVLRFPFTDVYFKKKSAHIACAIAWLIGIVLAAIPLLPATAHWHFYSQTGICIPLPITRNDFAGHDYSFAVIIIVNFILFLLIAAGQVFIYWSIHANTMSAGDSNKKSNDITIARRLITIAMSDFLCWFPIGLLGLMSSNGFPVPGEINVAIAIIFLPINSAINPFLYTINSLLEKRRKTRMQRLQKFLMTSLASKTTETAVVRMDDSYSQAEALRLINKWLSQGLFSSQNLDNIALNIQERQNACKNEKEL